MVSFYQHRIRFNTIFLIKLYFKATLLFLMVNLFLSYFPAFYIIHQSCNVKGDDKRKEGCTNEYSKNGTLQVIGASIYYEVRGSGSILLLIHGSGDADKFHNIADHLAKWYTVVTRSSWSFP